ncbi:MAG: prolipoprotein diacylglyceryl transferase [Alphaproteobacteria bacterium]|nr:prolipoprotein diacylglyceryl transferase [Alphaproteobacteria bacterium]
MTGIPFPDFDPVALHLGPLQIRWYALAYLSGFIGGWLYGGWLADRDPDRRPSREDIDNVLPWMVLGVILGGRIGYVLFYNLDYYLSDPIKIFYVWEGGMSFHGGLLGVAVVCIAYARYHKFHPFALGDIISVVAPIGLFFGRLANFVNGELYGRPTTVPWAMVFPSDPSQTPRHPSQLYEAFLEGFVLFVIMFFLARSAKIRRTQGFLFGALLVGYGTARFCVEYFREPDYQLGLYFNYFSMGQLLCLPMIAAGALVIRYARKKAAAVAVTAEKDAAAKTE